MANIKTFLFKLGLLFCLTVTLISSYQGGSHYWIWLIPFLFLVYDAFRYGLQLWRQSPQPQQERKPLISIPSYRAGFMAFWLCILLLMGGNLLYSYQLIFTQYDIFITNIAMTSICAYFLIRAVLYKRG